MPQPDSPELIKACDMLREIYWREYGRGWREAIAAVQKVLEQPATTETPPDVAGAASELTQQPALAP